MLKTIAASLFLLLGAAVATVPAVAAEPDHSAPAVVSPTLQKYAWMWSDKRAMTPSRSVVPVAACTLECCCQYFAGGNMKNECKSRDDCINAGGICRSKTDAKCN